jgi:trimeric autotransporter adhesin
LSTSGITSSLLSQIAGSPSAANQFATDLNQVAQDLKSDNLSAAQQDFVTLSQDALNGATASTATTSASGITTSLLSGVASSSSSESSFVSELNQLGADLQNGDLTSAQTDMLTLESTASGAAPAGAAGTTTSANQAQMTELINAIVQAIGAGDTSIVGIAMSQLASISPNSKGASVLEQDSATYDSSSSSSSSSIGELLQSLNTNSSASSQSALSLLA